MTMTKERLEAIKNSREFGLRTVTAVYLREAVAEIERLLDPRGGHDNECLSGACRCGKA